MHLMRVRGKMRARLFFDLIGIFKTVEFTAPPIAAFPQGNVVQRYRHAGHEICKVVLIAVL
jgi:sulfur carrier protein ThiS